MLKDKLLLFGAISALSSSTILANESEKCIGGACFVNLDRHQTAEGFKKEKQLVEVMTPRYLESQIDRSMTIVLDGETITVFPKSSYAMNENEVVSYVEDEEPSLLVIDDRIEDIILEKVIKLPNSEYFCEKNSMPVVHKESGFYECV